MQSSPQTPEWHPSEADQQLELASVSVPLDYEKPGGRQLSIAISRLRAADPAARRGTLVVLNGGPGGIGVGALGRRLPLRFAGTPVHRAYDIIGLDCRGTGDSTPLFCQVTKMRSGFDSRPPDSEFAAITADMRERDAGCQRAADGMRQYVSTRNTARDLDVVRRVLGEQKISFIGYAYGTYVGAVYGSLFPEHLDRSVLDSTVNPDWLWRQQFMSQAVAFRQNIDDWAAWAGQRPGRFGLGRSPAGVLAAVEEVAAKLAVSPVHGVTRTVLDGAMGPGATYRPLWPHLADIVRALGQGSGAGQAAPAAAGAAALAAVAAGGFTPPSAGLRPGVIDAVTCEKDWPADLGTYYRDMREFRDRYPYGYGVMRAGPWDCTFRTFTHPEPTVPLRRDGYPAGVVVHAECDATTPFEGGRVLAGQLGARLITVADEGFHEIYGVRGNRDVDASVTDYLVRGTLPPAMTVSGTPRPDVPAGPAGDREAAGEADLGRAVQDYIDRHSLLMS